MSEEMTTKQAMEILEAARKTMYLPKSGKYISDMGYALEKGIAALEAELATKTCNKQIVSKLENAELARDSEVTCNNKQVTSKLVASEDAISRQAAIDAFSMFAEYESNRTNAEWVDRIRVVLSSLPPVTPKQKTGHWIIITPTDMYCSECNEIEHLDTSRRFCAYCGARMLENPAGSESEG